MNNEEQEIYFDMDENMGSYYDFNLLDLLENAEDESVEIAPMRMDKLALTR